MKVILQKMASGQMADVTTERIIDDLTRQIEEIINDETVSSTLVFYTATESGGTAETKNIVKINKYGKIISWSAA